eukprot:3833786-Pyramimonas_sp.AAC.1
MRILDVVLDVSADDGISSRTLLLFRASLVKRVGWFSATFIAAEDALDTRAEIWALNLSRAKS